MRTVTTDLIIKVWCCLRMASYDRLKHTCNSELGSFCMFWSALHAKRRPLWSDDRYIDESKMSDRQYTYRNNRTRQAVAWR